jgi:membrane-associated phospholipid phosphatase
METIINLDYALFELINVKMSNAFFDFFLKWMRNEWIWVPFYTFIIAFFFFNYGKKGYWWLLFCLLTFATSDTVSSRIIKKSVERLRPCRNPEVAHVIPRIRCGSGFSFTSSHATNHFAIATFLALTIGSIIRGIRKPLWIWAGIIAIAQVYVGVHFPLDVLCGSALGIGIGYMWSKILRVYKPHLLSLINSGYV